MKTLNFTKEEDWLNSAIKYVENIYKTQEQNLHIALSGGSTPIPFYNKLASQKLPFEKTEFWQIDERYVDTDNPASNFNSINEHLLSKIKPQVVHRFDTGLPIKDCVKTYEDELNKHLPNLTFDLAIMGIGPDGHTASLFPGSSALDEEKKLALHTRAPDQFEIKDRLTVTFPLILKSKNILILLKNRPFIFEEIINMSGVHSDLPYRKLLNEKTTIFHLN